MVLARKSGVLKRRCPNDCGWSGMVSPVGLANHVRSCPVRKSYGKKAPSNATNETGTDKDKQPLDNMRAGSMQGPPSFQPSNSYGEEHSHKKVAVGTIPTILCKLMRNAGKNDTENYQKSIVESELTMEEVRENVPNLSLIHI